MLDLLLLAMLPVSFYLGMRVNQWLAIRAVRKLLTEVPQLQVLRGGKQQDKGGN